MFLFRKIGLYIAGLVILVGVLMPAMPAFAQTPPVRPPLNLMTSPLPLNVVTKPGQTVTADLRVKNNGTRPEVLKVELLKFGASGDTGRPQLMEREPQDMYFNWISFSETSFTADPNVWKTIKMTINAPKEAAFGYYFAVLFSRAVPDRPTGNQSAVEGGVASLVLLNVDAPGARRETKVAELVATQKVYEFLPAEFKVKLRNSGNVHVSPVGTMFIKRGDAQVAAINFNEERGNILPGTNRIFELDWADGFPAYVEKGQGSNASRSLEWDFGNIQKLRFGKYTATLVAVYDDGRRDVPIEAVVTFWVIPWRILGVMLIVVLLIGTGIWGIGRLLWKNVRRQVSASPDDAGPDASSLAAAMKKRPQKVKTKAAKKPDTATSKVATLPTAPTEPAAPIEEARYLEELAVVPAVAPQKPAKRTSKKSPAKTTRGKTTAAKSAVTPHTAPEPVQESPAPTSIADAIIWPTPQEADTKAAAKKKAKVSPKKAAKKSTRKTPRSKQGPKA